MKASLKISKNHQKSLNNLSNFNLWTSKNPPNLICEPPETKNLGGKKESQWA